jgi:anti-anti-sigma factor
MPLHLAVAVVGDETIVTVPHKRLEDASIKAVEEQLLRLVKQQERPRLCLDLSNVEYVSSVTLAKFVSINKRIVAAGGCLTLANVGPKIYRLLERTQLIKVLEVRKKEGEEGSARHPEPEA